MITGPHSGRLATVDSRVAQMVVDGNLETVPGYQVTLDSGAWATVRWDHVDWA